MEEESGQDGYVWRGDGGGKEEEWSEGIGCMFSIHA